GTGVLTFANQIVRGDAAALAVAQMSMATLNKAASEAMVEAGASACTDITGFGLFGHLIRLMRQHKLTARIDAESLPALPGAIEALRAGIVPGAIERNREYVGEDLIVSAGVDEALVNLGFDAQTSGGLLIAVAEARFERLRAEMLRRNVPIYLIGTIAEQSLGRIVLGQFSTGATRQNAGSGSDQVSAQPVAIDTTLHKECCAEVFGPDPRKGNRPSTLGECQRAFAALMRSAGAPGALSEHTKELIMFALVLHSRCAPCFDAHYKAAKEIGISQEELDEAAWCAIAMGGAPVRMFYAESLSRTRGETQQSCCQ
ncbi:MAG: AIR synthase-related protein, partial [Verrucomicrobiae bacterium]|nr:AIR synthase-related protein [Verrucomicrobiae bacterium]